MIRFVALFFAGMLMALPAKVHADAEKSARPNIVFIFADDWGWGDLSCHGHPQLKTPNLDRLASEGVDFQSFNVLNPVCSPSRTATMTGQYPARWSVHQHFASIAQNHERDMPDWLDPKAPMVPRMLKNAGYVTGHFGKWHLTSEMVPDAPPPTAYGFDEFKVFNSSHPNADFHDTADNAVAFIRAHKDQSFYVNVWLHEAHVPHVPTAESLAKWAGVDQQHRIYDAVITDGDNKVGKVLGVLKELGLEQNTLAVFSGDNGPEWTGGPNKRKMDKGFGSFYSVGSTGGLRGRKRSLFEGGVRVPFIVRWPGHTPAGKVDTTTVLSAVDLLPTFCEAAGAAMPADYRPDGQSILAALNGKDFKRTQAIFWEWRGVAKEPDYWPRLAVRQGDWKLVMKYDDSRGELYNEATDRPEKQDVASSHPEIVSQLRKMAQDWKATLPKSPPPGCRSGAPATGKPDAEEDK